MSAAICDREGLCAGAAGTVAALDFDQRAQIADLDAVVRPSTVAAPVQVEASGHLVTENADVRAFLHATHARRTAEIRLQRQLRRPESRLLQCVIHEAGRGVFSEARLAQQWCQARQALAPQCCFVSADGRHGREKVREQWFHLQALLDDAPAAQAALRLSWAYCRQAPAMLPPGFFKPQEGGFSGRRW